MSEFDEFIVHGEPGQKEKADAWQKAIGLQDLYGLKVLICQLHTKFQNNHRPRFKLYIWLYR